MATRPIKPARTSSARASKALARKRVPRIAFVYPPAQSNAREAVIGMYEFVARYRDWEVIHLEPNDRTAHDLEGIQGIDGVLVSGFTPTTDWIGAPERPWKCVLVFCEPWRSDRVVTVDEQAVARMALDEFADMAISHVGVFSHKPSARSHAFAEVAAERGIKAHVFNHNLPSMAEYWPRRHEVAGDWLRKLPKPIGLLVQTPGQAQAVCAAAILADVHVPEHVAILTAEGNAESCLMSRPTLSSITGMERTIGFEAARMLDRLLQGQPSGGPIEIAPTYVARRGSTDILAVADPELARAIRLLRAGATEDQTIDDVLAKVPLSRNQLEHGMRKTLGRSPYEEVMRVRIETACRLLRDSPMSLAEVAVHSGLGTVSNFCKIFHRKIGCTPRRYRMQTSMA